MKCSIDSKTREIIFLDSSECFGVEFDKKTQKLEFSCPKIVGDNLDLSQCKCRINYMNAKGYRDSYLIEDILVDGDDVTFTWTLSSKVTAGRGNCSFIFCARQVNENGVIEKEWNTTVAKASIKRGLETNSYIEEEHSDILESILSKIDKLENTEVITVKDWLENDTNSPKYIENRPGGYSYYKDSFFYNGTLGKVSYMSSIVDADFTQLNIDCPLNVSVNDGVKKEYLFSKIDTDDYTMYSAGTLPINEQGLVSVDRNDIIGTSDFLVQKAVMKSSNKIDYLLTFDGTSQSIKISQPVLTDAPFDVKYLNYKEVTIDGEIANYTGKQIYEFIQSGYNVVLRDGTTIYYPIVRTSNKGMSSIEFLGIVWSSGSYGPTRYVESKSFPITDTTGRYASYPVINLPYVTVPHYAITYYDKYESPNFAYLFGHVNKDDKALITGGSVYSAMISRWHTIKKFTINTNTTEFEPTINTKQFPDGLATVYILWKDLVSSSEGSADIYLNDVNVTENNSLISINGNKSSGWLIFEFNGFFWKLTDSFGEIPNEYKQIEGSRAKKIKIVSNAEITLGAIEIYGRIF